MGKGKAKTPAAESPPKKAKTSAKPVKTPAKEPATLKLTMVEKESTRDGDDRVWYRMWASPDESPRAFTMLQSKARSWVKGANGKYVLAAPKGNVDYVVSGGGKVVSNNLHLLNDNWGPCAQEINGAERHGLYIECTTFMSKFHGKFGDLQADLVTKANVKPEVELCVILCADVGLSVVACAD